MLKQRAHGVDILYFISQFRLTRTVRYYLYTHTHTYIHLHALLRIRNGVFSRPFILTDTRRRVVWLERRHSAKQPLGGGSGVIGRGLRGTHSDVPHAVSRSRPDDRRITRPILARVYARSTGNTTSTLTLGNGRPRSFSVDDAQLTRLVISSRVEGS